MILRELELGAIKAHILWHAAQAPIYGVWMAEELARHGYTISYGTLYPTLRRMTEEGLLSREERREGSHVRKYYTPTPAGHVALAEARRQIAELAAELLEPTRSKPPGTHIAVESSQRDIAETEPAPEATNLRTSGSV